METPNRKYNLLWVNPDQSLSFGDIIQGLNDGKLYCRRKWTHRPQFIFLATDKNVESVKLGDRNGRLPVLPFVVIQFGEKMTPLLFVWQDLLASDWKEVIKIPAKE